MSKIKKILVAFAFLITTLIIVFNLIVPNILRSREGEMKRFLDDMGYKGAKMIGVSGWRSQVTFKTKKGIVNVVTTRNGGLAIKY